MRSEAKIACHHYPRQTLKLTDYLRPSVSNGDPREQAMIRRWWYERHGAKGRLVWEYYLEGRYIDSFWFPGTGEIGVESVGLGAPTLFPLAGQEVVLCEAKSSLIPELVGQALVFTKLALRAHAIVKDTVVFAEIADKSMRDVAVELGLTVNVAPLDTFGEH
jgi:hypothetical protein